MFSHNGHQVLKSRMFRESPPVRDEGSVSFSQFNDENVLLQMWQFETGDSVFSSPVLIPASPRHPDASCAAECDPTPCDASTQHTTNGRQAYVIGSHDNHVHCLSEEGLELWKVDMKSPVYATPFHFSTAACDSCEDHSESQPHVSHYIAVVSTQGQMNVLNAADGRCVSGAAIGREVFSSPVVCGDKLVVGCRDDFVYCFQLTFRKVE